jgi:hypothetical protein
MARLQPPIVDWACPPVDLGTVRLGNPGVPPDHREVGMPQERLQREDIALVAQVGDCEGVPKAMRVDVPHTCLVANAVKVLSQYSSRH